MSAPLQTRGDEGQRGGKEMRCVSLRMARTARHRRASDGPSASQSALDAACRKNVPQSVFTERKKPLTTSSAGSVVRDVANGPDGLMEYQLMRFNQMRRYLGDVTDCTPSAKLRGLEADGLAECRSTQVPHVASPRARSASPCARVRRGRLARPCPATF